MAKTLILALGRRSKPINNKIFGLDLCMHTYAWGINTHAHFLWHMCAFTPYVHVCTKQSSPKILREFTSIISTKFLYFIKIQSFFVEIFAKWYWLPKIININVFCILLQFFTSKGYKDGKFLNNHGIFWILDIKMSQ